MGERDKSNKIEFNLKLDHRTVENRSGCTHPGAEHSAVRSRLMMRVVPGMLDRLGLSQSADRKNAEHQDNRQDFEDAVAHQKATRL